jgi:sarcosine oxidase/L-pipecolate oxidase
MSTSYPIDQKQSASILIVGAGVFGLTTALELSRRGFTNIKVFDRALPPVFDGSSVDISRVMRVDYADQVYADMAAEAQAEWSSTWSSWYHRAGFLTLSDTPNHSYIEKAKSILLAKEQPFTTLSGLQSFTHLKKSDLPGYSSKTSGYLNPNAGWVDAAGSIGHLAQLCSQNGVSFVTGTEGTVISLNADGDKVLGVRVAPGKDIFADFVILSAGAWSRRLVDLGSSIATGQPVGFIQLTAEEAAEIKDMPITINYSDGVFCFPPTPDTHILKVVRHGHGYETTYTSDTTTKSVSSPPLQSRMSPAHFIPEDANGALRNGLARMLPQFAQRPWLRTRLCWYFDRSGGDFLIDFHPQMKNLFLATAGCGQ